MKVLFSLLLFMVCLFANSQPFTQQDSLRGSITPEREWWDLTYYHLDVEVLPATKQIRGSNLIHYTVIAPHQVLQIDLQAPLQITKVLQGKKELSFTSNENAHFIQLKKKQEVGKTNSIQVFYEGTPVEAMSPPWDGGFSWNKDEMGKDFIATTCQGIGASLWWPCKDHMYDEVDSMLISVEVPQHLVDVSNGRLRKVDYNKEKKTKTYNWFVANPINNYGVNLNIGNYISWNETYKGENGELDLSYWVLTQNEKEAKKQFKEVHKMLKAFEYWFGPYPFYEDGYKLVHVPYLGMEHQSSVTYGNEFKNGYRGKDLSGTGWGLKFDFIIVHESGHEWFANNITHKDIADMWIHESFTNYSESIFLEYHYGKKAAQEYLVGIRKNINNDKPMIGNYDVNDKNYTPDVYYKGANMLNTLRSVLNDDKKWRALLRGLNTEFYHKTVTSKDVENYMASFFILDLSAFFDQYLRNVNVPTLEYYFEDGFLHYHWKNTIGEFDMPVDITVHKKKMRLFPTTSWQKKEIQECDVFVNPSYYIRLFKIDR